MTRIYPLPTHAELLAENARLRAENEQMAELIGNGMWYVMWHEQAVRRLTEAQRALEDAGIELATRQRIESLLAKKEPVP